MSSRIDYYHLHNFFASLKRLVGGVPGENGANALKRVAVGHSIANGPVPGPLRDMEENRARDKTSRHEPATQNNALVSIEIFTQTNPMCLSSSRGE